ncbi:unnamed protein product [marine sediment metagenome]|uniref:Uncharacterized protein n=1 Tax=marine sediment metagenome TaxID=412755 RepID=X1UC53_9ZZZZ
MLLNKTTNRTFLPRNLSLANPKATIEQLSTIPTIVRPVTIKLFLIKR